MAMTTKYGFFYDRHLLPSNSTPAVIQVTLKNSAGPLVIGNGVEWDSTGFLDGATVNEGFLGILVGLVTSSGENIFKTKSKINGTIVGTDTFTASATNQTVEKVQGVVAIDPMALFFAYSDTTLAQSSVGLFFNGKVNGNTYIDGVTGAGAAYSAGTQQFQLVELVTTGFDGTALTTAGLFRIIRSQININDPAA